MRGKIPFFFAVGVASSVFLLAAPRGMRAAWFTVALLAVLVSQMRNRWLMAWGVAVLLSWSMGDKGATGGWNAALLAVLGALVCDKLIGLGDVVAEALVWMSIPCAAMIGWAYHSTGQWSGSLDNPVVAGPAFAVMSLLVFSKNKAVAGAYAVMCLLQQSTTGAVALVACYSPAAAAWVWKKTVGPMVVAFLAGYVFFIDRVHVGYWQRWEVITETLRAAWRAPLGHGWGSFYEYGIAVFPPTWDGMRWGHVHSDFVQIWFEGGVFPVVVVVAYLVARVARNLPRTDEARLAFGGMLAVAVVSGFSLSWHVAPGAAAFMAAISRYEEVMA